MPLYFSMLIVLLLFVFPVLIIYISPFCYKKRVWIFCVAFISIVSTIVLESYTLYDLGFRFDNFEKGLVYYALFTCFGVFFIWLLAKSQKYKSVKNWWSMAHFQYGFIVVSFIQELVYRGYLIPKLHDIFILPILIIITNSLIFAFIHIIYPNRVRNFTLTFIAGLGFSSIYILIPNLFLVTLSHAVLNFASLFYGLIGPKDFT
jgi:uncharacterized protein